MISSVVIKTCAGAVSVLLGALALAGGEHDHGATKPTASGAALPRFSMQSDLFEAVGVLLSDELSVLVDRTASNEPVLNATIELESSGTKLIGKFHADRGDYSFDSKPFARAGAYPITLTIRAGAESDLLTGELDVHGAEKNTPAVGGREHGWQRAMLWGGGALIAGLLLFLAIRRFVLNHRNSRNRLGAAA